MESPSKQIIPDLQAVARCFDRTFLISELLENFRTPVDERELFIEQLKILHLDMKTGGYSRDHYRDTMAAFLDKSNIIEEGITIKLLEDGMDCSLLQPGSKGWQKGKLKICFEFIPEESETVVAPANSVETTRSPLDEIRQLANSLPIDQN
jgi:KGK domain